jgi:DNA anti-recombination protein RmuC
VFNRVVTQTLSSVSEEWTQKTSRFIQLYSSAQMEKESLLGQLKHRLGHPSATQELKDLDAQAQKTVAELHEYMGQMNVELRDGFGRISQQVLDQVEFLTAAWSGLLDGLVMIQHVDVPRKNSLLENVYLEN